MGLQQNSGFYRFLSISIVRQITVAIKMKHEAVRQRAF
jgi:hypothetical protein